MKKLFPILLILVLLLCACGQEAAGSETAQPAAQSGEQAAAAGKAADAGGASDHTVITLSGGSAKISGGGARDESDAVTISAAGTYEVTGSGSKMLVVNTGDDAMEVTLILNNAQITNLSGPAVHVQQAKNFRLQLVGQSTLTSGEEAMLQSPDPEASGAALLSDDDMDIEGEGSLVVCGYINNGIGCKNDLDINGGDIAVLAANNGVRGSDSVEMKGGSLSVSAWGDGIKSVETTKEGKGYVELKGGTVSVEAWGDGIQAATELRILDGSLTVVARGDGVETSSKALKGESLVLLSGGQISLESQEAAVRCSTGNVEITGGSLTAYSLTEGVYAGDKNSAVGDILVSGGELSVSAGKQALKARGSFAVTGGSIRALSGSEKQAAPTGTASLLCAIAGAAGDDVQLGELGTVQARQSYKTLLLVDSSLSSGQSVTVSNRTGSVEAQVR